MNKLISDKDEKWGVQIDNRNKDYNIKCFGIYNLNDYYIMILISERELSEVELFYEDYHDIRFKWEKIYTKPMETYDDNLKFICAWSVNCLDYLADKEYFQLTIFEKYCYIILGKYIKILEEL